MIAHRSERTTQPPEETARDVHRLVWAASGLGFLACEATGLLLATVFSTALYPSPFGPPFGPQSDVASYFAANSAQVRGMSFVFTLAALCLLVFVAYSAGMLADRTPQRRSPLPGLALGAGSLSAGFWLLNALLLWVLSRPAPAADAALQGTLHELVYLAGGPAHPVAGAVSGRRVGRAVAVGPAAQLDRLDRSGGGGGHDSRCARAVVGAGHVPAAGRPGRGDAVDARDQRRPPVRPVGRG